jgi:hypothetical protein
MAVGLIWASHRSHNLDCKILRDFRVNIVFAAVGALRGELCLILLFPLSIVDDRSAVTVTMIYKPLISFPARVQEDGEVMEH